MQPYAVTVAADSPRKEVDVRLLPSMLNATPSEVAAFRAYMRDRYRVPPDTSPDKADLAFEELADKIIAYLSSPDPKSPDPPYKVGACRGRGRRRSWSSGIGSPNMAG